MSALHFVVAADQVGRVDLFLGRQFPGVSRRRLARMFADGEVRIGGRVARKGDRVAAGDQVTVADPPPRGDDLRAVPDESVVLPVLHLDPALVAIAKPAGMASHPLRAGEPGTAANHLVARFPECRQIGDDPREAGLVHRLDRDTSGVLLAARDPESWRAVRERFRQRKVHKEYLALVDGVVAADGGIDAPLAQRGRRVAVAGDGLPAATRWRPLGSAGGRTLVRCTAATGRMHQVRAHLAHAGTPIVGDALYGGSPGAAIGLVGHFLHAAAVELVHPRTGQRLRIVAPLDPDRREALRRSGFESDQIDLDQQE